MAKAPRTAGSEQDAPDDYQPSDADLGVGAADPMLEAASANARIEAAMGDPVIAAAIEEVVAKRVAEMAVATAQAPAGVDFLAAMQALGKQIADSINRSTSATVEQLPGHVKPIPVEEVEARAAAFIEMQSLIRDSIAKAEAFHSAGTPHRIDEVTPIYLLRADCFLNGEIGSEYYVAGKTVRWFAAPNVEMEPRNPIAERISDAMWRYIGEERPPNAEDLGAYASAMGRPSLPGANVPELPSLASRLGRSSRFGASVVEGAPEVDVGPGRIMGTIVREIKGGFGRGAITVEPGGHYSP